MANLSKNNKPEGLAKVLAIGTANPDNILFQDDFPDYYFRIFKSDHLPDFKDKLKRICEKSMVRKRHIYLTDDHLEDNPSLLTFMGPTLDIRQEMVIPAVPKLGAEAAVKALAEWGQPASHITHLIFCTSSGINMPGADYHLTKLLHLNPNVNRFMLYQQGCFAGATALRLAKDLAESTRGARVLVVCSEINSVMGFREPSEAHIDVLVGAALFGDGAAAVVVGADADPTLEPAFFELVWAGQSLIPGSEGMIEAPLKEAGLVLRLKKEMAVVITDNVEERLEVAFEALGVRDWRSVFWVVHPGGPAILNKVEARLELGKERMRATRHVLSEYGNMSSPTVLFVLDEMRRRSAADGAATTGEGLEWGVLFGFGPGLTAETVVLRSIPFAQ